MNLLLVASTAYQACSFGSVNANNWIYVNALVLTIAISLGAIFYALSNILPAKQGAKLKGYVKAEVLQGVLGVIIVGVLVGSVVTWCNIGSSLAGSAAQNPMQFSESYLQTLIFRDGLSLFDSVYAETALLMINWIVIQHISGYILNSFSVLGVSFSNSAGVTYEIYALGFGTAALTIFSVIFGVLFVVYLVLPLVSATALTVVVPTAIVMRMVPFMGPKIREMSDVVLAIGIAAYFIFPLMIVMNNMLVGFLYSQCGSGNTFCNPYSTYLGAYSIGSLPTGSLFNSNPASYGSVLSVPKNFFYNIITSSGGFLNAAWDLIKSAFDLPAVFMGFAQEIAIFMFQGIFLIGLDVLVTVTFAKALAEGLSAISNVVSEGAFWG